MRSGIGLCGRVGRAVCCSTRPPVYVGLLGQFLASLLNEIALARARQVKWCISYSQFAPGSSHSGRTPKDLNRDRFRANQR